MSCEYSVTIATTTIWLVPEGAFAKVAEEKEQLGRDGGRGRLRDKAVTPHPLGKVFHVALTWETQSIIILKIQTFCIKPTPEHFFHSQYY